MSICFITRGIWVLQYLDKGNSFKSIARECIHSKFTFWLLALSHSFSGILIQAFLWELLRCRFKSKEFKTAVSYGEYCMTKDPAGNRSPYSWDASPSRSRSPWLKSASACSMESLLWTISFSRTARCLRRWLSALRTHIFTARTRRRAWSICSAATLWMTAGMDQMRKDAVSVFDVRSGSKVKVLIIVLPQCLQSTPPSPCCSLLRCS